MTPPDAKLAVALVHHPVMNKRGDIVTTSVTTLDVHDMARVCKTYGVDSLYIITPLRTQQKLVERLARHWTEGFGAKYNPHRKEALTALKVVDSIEDMMDNFSLDFAGRPLTLFTGAKRSEKAVSYADARARMEQAGRAVILFGTGHGLADSVLEKCDIRLEPIEGTSDFNHLPVRCAAAITLDRLFGRRNNLGEAGK